MTWKCKSVRGKKRNKKNIENKKDIDAGVKFDARLDDKLKFFLRCLKLQKTISKSVKRSCL